MANNKIRKMHIIVTGLILLSIGGIISFYLYLWTPMQVEKEGIKQNIEQLESTYKEPSELEEQLSAVRKQVVNKEKEVEKIREGLNQRPVEYIEFIDKLGDIQDSAGVELVTIEKNEMVKQETHWEVPYNLLMAGNYKEILAFVNGVYEMDMPHVVTQIRLKKDTSVMTSTNNKILSENWAKDIIADINKIYGGTKPITETEEDKEETTEAGDVETQSTTSPEDEILYLDFSFKFITIKDPGNR